MALLRVVFVFFAFFLAQCVLIQSECRIPSQFWCDDAITAAKCGVEAQCKALKRSTANTPVEFTLYYESLCPDCKQMFEYQIIPAYQKVGSIVNMKFVPYGNAQEYYDYNRKQWTFYCQHGQQECIGNIIETCAMNIYQNASDHFPFLACMERSNYYPQQSAQICAGQYKLDYQKIMSCTASVQGNTWEHEMAQKTDALYPRHQYVPWVTLNGAHTQQIQNMAMSNLVGLICSSYTGTPKPPACV